MLTEDFSEPDVAAHACNPSTWEVAAEEFKVAGPLWLCIALNLGPYSSLRLSNQGKVSGW